jgi:two-component system, NarL family, nitrate/nitrite response regulator NarL
MTFIPVERANASGSPRSPVRVVLSDDECLFRASLRQLLSVPPQVIKDVYGVDVGAGFEVVGEAGSGEETVRVVGSVRPDVLVLDLSMPRMSGLEALRELQSCRETTRTILLAGTIDRQHLLTAVHLGVRGLLLKDVTTELLFEALVSVVAGQYWLDQTLISDLLETVRPLIQSSNAVGGKSAYGLTTRERQILAMVAAGQPNKEIARVCSVSEQTIKHHVTRMFDKVGASNRVELAMLATRQGLLDAVDVPTPPQGVSLPAVDIAPPLPSRASLTAVDTQVRPSLSASAKTT